MAHRQMILVLLVIYYTIVYIVAIVSRCLKVNLTEKELVLTIFVICRPFEFQDQIKE